MESIKLRNAAAAARRTATAIRNLTALLGSDADLRPMSGSLTGQDREALATAAMVLSRIGTEVGKVGRRKKREEEALDAVIAKARAEARRIMATWPELATVLDKVALIAASGRASQLERDLSCDRSAWSLSYWLDEARRDIPNSVGYQAATKHQVVGELMVQIRAKVESLASQPTVIDLAQRWEAALTREAAGR
jgi:hypothetical protein